MPARIINQAKSVFRSRTIFVARRAIERDEEADILDVSLISSSFCASRGSLWQFRAMSAKRMPIPNEIGGL